MKKILLTLIISFFALPVLSQVIEPQWSEFCFSQYQNAAYKKPTFWNSLGYNSRVDVKENNYWVNRRQEFDNSVRFCKENRNNQDHLFDCYQQVRNNELVKTQNHLIELQVEQNKRQNYLNAVNTFNQNMQTQQMINNQKRYIDAYNMRTIMPQTHNVNIYSY